MDLEIKKCSEHYNKLLSRAEALLNESENTLNIKKREKIKKEVDEILKEVSEYAETIYAKAVYDVYASKAPMLINLRTGEEQPWTKEFGNDFESIPNIRRNALVGLIEGKGKYRFK